MYAVNEMAVQLQRDLINILTYDALCERCRDTCNSD